MFCQSKPHENPTNQGSEDIHNSQNFTKEENHTRFALEGLRVCSQLGLNQEWISLPITYIKEDLPVDSWEVAIAQKLKKWKHLSCVAGEVMKDDQNINVELLIGDNWIRALEPIKVIPSRNDGSYVMKTSGLVYCWNNKLQEPVRRKNIMQLDSCDGSWQ